MSVYLTSKCILFSLIKFDRLNLNYVISNRLFGIIIEFEC